jgi:hypothetical protein
MSDAVERVVEELKKLLDAAATQEEKSEIWAFLFERLHEVSDDDEWAGFRKHFEEAAAKRNAH